LQQYRNERESGETVETSNSELFTTNDEERADAQDTLMDRVKAVIAALPPRSREILVLRWYHGLGLEAIASIMGISYGSARVLHSRALAGAKTKLGVR
jgi:RNA polymerase sigma factor (sigma-70 family)